MSILDKALSTIQDKVDLSCENIDPNVGSSERVLSVISGGFILGIGIRNLFSRPMSALSGIALGGALVYRGVTGKCKLKSMLNEEKHDAEATVIEHRYFVK